MKRSRHCMTFHFVGVRNQTRRQVDGGLCIDETKDGVGPNKDGPLNQPKLKPPSKLGHKIFQRQSTETRTQNRTITQVDASRVRILRPTSFFSVVAASTQHHYHYHYIYVNPTLLSFHLFTFFQPLKSNLPLFLLPPTSPSSSSIMSHFKGKYHGNSLPPSLSHALIYLVVIVSCLSGSQCFFFYLLFRLSLLCLFESI